MLGANLNQAQIDTIYDEGRRAALENMRAAQAAVAKNATIGSSAVGKVHFAGDRTTLAEKQNVSLTALETVADVMGVQIHVFESQVNERGKRIGANGWYDPSDSSIHIDLHAGANGEGTMLFTAAHELTHHIKQWSPEKFKTLSDFLMQEYGKKDVNVDGLVREQIAKAKRNRGYNMTYDEAFEEVVADSMESMLADGKIVEKLAKLKQTDKSLWQKVKDFISELAAKIRSAYEKMAPDSVEGRYVAEMKDSIEKLQELFTEGLVDASENYQSSLTPGEEGVIVNENGDPVAYSTDDGSVLLSMRTYEEEGREAFRKYLQKCVTSKKLTKAEMQEMMDGIEDIYMTCKEFKDKYAPFSSWSDAAVVRDTRGKPVFSVVTPNGDYKMNLDFSLVCKKRRTLDAVFNEMTKRGIIDDFELGQKSVVKFNEIIRKYGLETACALCFVDAKRFRQASMADQFTRLYNELVESLVPEDQKGSIDHFNFSGYSTIKKVEGGIDTWDNSKLDFSHLNHVLKTYGDRTVEYKAAKYIKTHPEGRKLLLRGDFMSSQGFDAVKTQNQDILKLYNSKKGTGGPKAAFGDVQYMNEIIQKARWWTPAKAYAVGGVRIQSFSDYVPRMVFDYTQMIYDLAATKLPAHAYTKEALFVKQFGLTGVKINMSLIPAIAEGGIAPGLDANGNYVWAGESFDFETAKEIQNAEGYTENCGTICVGVSYEHIRKLLSDPDIRMVIPYHKSGLNPIVAHMNKIAEFTDYTTLQTNPGGCQNTMDKNGSKVETDFNFNEVLRKTGDPKATVRQYLDWCSKHEYTPRFAEFAWHENYYKLIEDFTLFDKDGNYVPQREVRAVFPKADSAFGSMKDLIQEGLEEDAVVEGKREKNLSAIVDEIQETIPKTEAEIEETQVEQADRDLEAETKYSIREDIVDVNGVEYDRVVELDYKVFNRVKRSGKAYIDFIRNNLIKQKITVFNDNGDSEVIEFAGANERVLKSGAKNKHPVIGELTQAKNETQKLVIVNAVETAEISRIAGNSNEHSHQWLDENGWEERTSHVMTKDGTVYPVTLHIAKARDGRNILYDVNVKINEGIAADKIATSLRAKKQARQAVRTTKPSGNKVPQKKAEVKKFSDRDNAPLYSDRDTDSVSNRTLLVNALESAAKTPEERVTLQKYRERIAVVEDTQRRLDVLNGLIREKSFAPGKRNTTEIEQMRKTAEGLAKTINGIDKQILTLEASAPLKAVLEREKKKAYERAEQKGRDALKAYRKKEQAKQKQITQRYQESRAKGIESRKKTAMRHKVQKKVDELNRLLLNGTKEHHVPETLKNAVAEILDAVDMEVSNEEQRKANYEATLAQYDRKIAMESDPKEVRKLIEKRKAYEDKGDQFKAKMDALHKAYEEIKNDKDPIMTNAYDEGLSAHIMTLMVEVGDTPLGQMDLYQLECVHDVLQTVLTSVRNANKAFKAAKGETIAQMGNSVMEEVERVGGKKQYGFSFMNGVKKFGWNNLKPVYAFQHIGSGTLSKLFDNVRAGEDTWARDLVDARAVYLEKAKKYGYNGWDMEQTHTFESASGMEFGLNLPQIMSLYAYSKREQAAEHLRQGGIVIDESTEVTMKTKLGFKVKFNPTEATAYNISDDTLAEIVSKLTPEQKSFVDEMQDYLSTTMGEKGNEVSLQMYGIKLFKEKNYFPLKSAPQHMAKAKEQQKGEVKIKNSGFSKETVKKANNPVVLTPFMEVWAEHVNDMSMYHAFVLPLEDFYRVYNFKTATSETTETRSVESIIQNAYGKAATGYIDQLLKDLNGGARADTTTGVITKSMNLFKKGAVFASASVVIQQPSAIARATALIDPRYFVGRKVDKKRHKELWKEIKKYAPVAVIKEMGYFDTNMGKSTQDFLLGKEYKGIGEKMIGFVADGDYRDEVLSKATALADELAWCAIWEACQREVIDKHPGMLRRDREGFMKLAGERFTEVIVKTQVYDSVLSRSANMRSKDTGMKMATAFMAEPTTSINMVADALLQAKRGNGRYARKAIGSVIASQILNAVLVSFVYAARDDDEDETYAEKYLGSLVSEVVDGINPATYVPFVKDIASIVQGYEVERSDMAVISDLWNAWQKLDSETVSTWQKVEGFAGSIAQIFGLPVKNIMRDVRSIRQFIETVGNGEKNTWPGAGYALLEGVFGKTFTRREKLYDALLGNDAAQLERVKKWYLEDADGDTEQMEKDIASAMRAAIKDRYVNEEIDAMTASKYLVLYGDQDGTEARWTLDEWDYAIAHGSSEDYSKFNDFYAAIDSGENLEGAVKALTSRGVETGTLSGQITGRYKDDYLELTDAAEKEETGKKLIAAWMALGYTRTEAERNLEAWDFEAESGFNYSSRKKLYLDGEITAAELKEAAMTYGGLSETDADFYLAKLDFEIENGYAYDDIRKLYLDQELTAEQVRNAVMTVGGKSQRQADEYLADLDFERENGYSYENRKDAYISGQITDDELRSAMIGFGGVSEKEADAYVDACDWLLAHPGSGLTVPQVQSYTKTIENYGKSIEDVGISPKLFTEIVSRVNKCEGTDSDGDGKPDYNSAKNQKLAVIDSYDLTVEQKDALYFYNDWAKSKLWQAPWH